MKIKKKEIGDLLKIPWVRQEWITCDITKDNIYNFIDMFRKFWRPTYKYINALITINRLQNHCARLTAEKHEEVAKAQARTRKAEEIHVLYWFVAILLMIVFAIWFWTIVAFIFSKIV